MHEQCTNILLIPRKFRTKCVVSSEIVQPKFCVKKIERILHAPHLNSPHYYIRYFCAYRSVVVLYFFLFLSLDRRRRSPKISFAHNIHIKLTIRQKCKMDWSKLIQRKKFVFHFVTESCFMVFPFSPRKTTLFYR